MRALLAALLVFAAGAVNAETCVAPAGTNSWASSLALTPSNWTGCTPSADDVFEVPSGATVDIIDDIDLSAGGATCQIDVQSGGTLNFDIADNSDVPMTLTLCAGPSDVAMNVDGAFNMQGAFVQAGLDSAGTYSVTPPGYVYDKTETNDTWWYAGLPIHCDTLAGVTDFDSVTPDCSGADSDQLTIVWGNYWSRTGIPSAFDWLYYADSFPNVDAGMIAVFADPSLATGMAWEVEADATGSGDGPFEMQLNTDFSPQTRDLTNFPFTRKDYVEVTTAAAASQGARCVEVADGVLTSTNHYRGRALSVDIDEGATDHRYTRPYRIMRTVLDTGCDGAAAGASEDSIWILDPNGFDVAVSNATTMRITYGVQQGDPFYVMAPVRIFDGTPSDDTDGQITIGSAATISWEAAVLSGQAQIHLDAAGSGISMDYLAFYDGGQPIGDWLERNATDGFTASHLSFMGGPTTGRSHPIVLRGDGRSTLTDIHGFFTGDDLIAAGGTSSTVCVTATRVVYGFAPDNTVSSSAVDMAAPTAAGCKNQATDIVCIAGNFNSQFESVNGAGAAECVKANAANPISMSRIAVVGTWAGSGIRGDEVSMAKDILIAGADSWMGSTSNGTSDYHLNSTDVDGFYLTHFDHEQTTTSGLVGGPASLSNGVVDTVRFNGAFANLSGGNMISNVLIVDSDRLDTDASASFLFSVQTCSRGSSALCALSLDKITHVTRGTTETDYEVFFDIVSTSGYGDDTIDITNIQIGPLNQRVGNGGTRAALTFAAGEVDKIGTFSGINVSQYNTALATNPSTAVHTLTSGQAAAFATKFGAATFQGINPGLNRRFVTIENSFANENGLGAGSGSKKPGLQRDGYYLRVNGVEVRDFNFGGGVGIGGGGSRSFAPTPF